MYREGIMNCWPVDIFTFGVHCGSMWLYEVGQDFPCALGYRLIS